MQRQYLFADMQARVRAAAAACVAGADLSRVLVEPSQDPAHGDMASNAAMVLAKAAGMKPRDLAEAIAARLRDDDKVAKVDVAGPGFINLTLKPPVWLDELRDILDRGAEYGRSTAGGNKRVNVEYVSANPTGPVHVGHARGAVFGDALASLLSFVGYDVTREYYINDAGAQVDVLARSAYLRYREALGENIDAIPKGLYAGDYLKPAGRRLAILFEHRLTKMSEAEWMPIVRASAIGMMMDSIREDLAALGVKHDVFFSERSLIDGEKDKVRESIATLATNGHVYKGRLPPPKGGDGEDWEDHEQTLFRSTAFGDDSDRALLKSDGGYTYFASDIAYHQNKLMRGFWNIIDIWGADHSGYIKRMKAAVDAVGFGQPNFTVDVVQLVRLLRDGNQVQMSKRNNEFITLREVVDEIGSDAMRFDMLYFNKDTTIDFDLAKVIENSSSNPVFYVQYGHARACSVLRKAVAELTEADGRAERFGNPLLARLTDEGEISLLRKLALYPRIIEGAAAAHEPHRVAFYLHDLVGSFHSQWTRGNDIPGLRFILADDMETTAARLALVQGVTTVLGSGLKLLGVSAPHEMHHEPEASPDRPGARP